MGYVKRCRSGVVFFALLVFAFLHSSPAWSVQDLGLTPSALVSQLKSVLNENGMTTMSGDKIVIGDIVRSKDKTGAAIFTSSINQDLILSGSVSAQSGNVKSFYVEIAMPENTESARLENAAWLHGFFSSMSVSLFSAETTEYQRALEMYQQNIETLLKNYKADAQLDLEFVKVGYHFSANDGVWRLRTTLSPQ